MNIQKACHVPLKAPSSQERATQQTTMRLRSNSPAYKELHRRLDAARKLLGDLGMTEEEMYPKLCEVRDEYIHEIRIECNMGVHEWSVMPRNSCENSTFIYQCILKFENFFDSFQLTWKFDIHISIHIQFQKFFGVQYAYSNSKKNSEWICNDIWISKKFFSASRNPPHYSRRPCACTPTHVNMHINIQFEYALIYECSFSPWLQSRAKGGLGFSGPTRSHENLNLEVWIPRGIASRLNLNPLRRPIDTPSSKKGVMSSPRNPGGSAEQTKKWRRLITSICASGRSSRIRYRINSIARSTRNGRNSSRVSRASHPHVARGGCNSTDSRAHAQW